uniref:C-type lectin domain-containing protein n=1 Tax=Gasterosteus aculeatus aculeatus TaxID=481459 RepID=G3P4G1_GASAC|nr:C-type lectin domain family 4 member F-like isoform X1 [Gasterosteus aculeatus aculeatus]
MSTPGGSLACEGMYSKLIEDEVNSRPDVGLHAHPAPRVRMAPIPGGPGPYRLATICLAALSAVLLISIIAVTSKKGPQRDAGGTSEMQMKDANTSALIATISKLQQEKEELQAKLDLMAATKVPEAIKPPTRTPTRAPTRAPPVCSPDWSLFNDSCYFISRTSRDWPESKSFCESQGAHLAIILTAEEQTFLWDLLPRGHWNSYWFGITDEHTEDQWKWVDGTPLVGGFWEAGEPNNHIDEDCGYIVKTQVMERVAIRSWYDAPCSMYLPFICEKQMGGGASTAVPH